MNESEFLTQFNEFAKKLGYCKVDDVEAYDHDIAELKRKNRILVELLLDENCPVKYYNIGGTTYAVYGTSSISFTEEIISRVKKYIEAKAHMEWAESQPGYQTAVDIAYDNMCYEAAEKELEEALEKLNKICPVTCKSP